MVASGENIYTIANRYGVTPKDIRKWNGLGSNRVAKGRRLRLHVDNGGVAFASVKTKKTEKDGAVKAGQKATPVVTIGLTSAYIRPGQVLKIPVV